MWGVRQEITNVGVNINIIKPERFKVAYWDKQDNKKQRFKSLKDLNVERVSHDI